MARTNFTPEAVLEKATHSICPVCGSAEPFTRRQVLDSLAMLECSCGLVIGDFRIAQHARSEYEALIDLEHYERSIGVMRRAEASEHVAMVSDVQVRAWFDVGCGIGAVLQEARRAGYAVAGAEPDALAHSIASASVPNATIVRWFDKESVPDYSQGVVSMLDVLEHIAPEELSDMAALVRAKLCDGGYWLIKVPSADGLYYLLANAVARVAPRLAASTLNRLWLTPYAAPHRVYFAEKTLSRFVRNHGFDVVAVKYTPTVPAGTILSRLRMDKQISTIQAYLMAPLMYGLNIIEHMRGKTDSVVLLCRKNR